MTLSTERFNFSASQRELEELRHRIELGLTRIPEPIPDTEWEYGTKRDTLVELVRYWKDDYDWKAAEKRIFGDFQHFRAPVNGVDVHFIHERSNRDDALPLILIHGWPGSFFEFIDLIHEFANPSDPSQPAFHVIVPSLPGYGFSSAPKVRGFDTREIGKTFDELMKGLGYAKYFAQGGDWGSIISRQMAIDFPDSCRAIHINMCIIRPPSPGITTIWMLFKAVLWGLGFKMFSEDEDKWLKATQNFMEWETDYQKIQETKPQSLGYAFNDSPVGLAAWILEKFETWGDCRGDVLGHFGKDRILTNIMIYWLSGSITSSMRLYYEGRHNLPNLVRILTVYHQPPVAVANFAEELYRGPREWAANLMNLQQWSIFPSGGHFAAMEEPTLLLGDVRKFFGRKDIAKLVRGSSKL
ncbi:epoxide hydrolase domain protein [Gonapodya prolifera JEL478]|uniref:Epoxide hydrolase domain protein n=1 Tax=Gonapodya prolifera (strain JEL478) TaxID=1344416 RepID=A0A139A853_GONPJ|nr:epoxide hydrolase domain protein [Gonapodya prolifera JEL478]|eukprot:KXS12563.1 epoxide hydrolase domain protein [Gonapodya prolifera JEL478]